MIQPARIGQPLGENVGSVKTSLDPSPPMGWNRDYQIQVVAKVAVVNMESKQSSQLNSELLVVPVFHFNDEFLQQPPIVAHRNGGFKSKVEVAAKRAAIIEGIVGKDDRRTFMTTA